MARNYFVPVPPRKQRLALDLSTSRSLAAPQTVSLRRPPRRGSDAPSRATRTLDGFVAKRPNLLEQVKKDSLAAVILRLFRRFQIHFRYSRRVVASFLPEIAPRKMVYGSLSAGVALGMMGMNVAGQLSGEDVAAQVPSGAAVRQAETEVVEFPEYSFENDIFFEYFNEESEEIYQENVRKLVAGHPIEEMLPYIFEKDHLVAAFLIGIAKKESNWGKRVPVLNGQDCFNYWGYRGVRKMMGTGGHTCFNSRKDAVDTVAKRLENLIHSQKLDTPEKMIVWKCGYSCEGHSRESVRKWIADVDHYFREASYE